MKAKAQHFILLLATSLASCGQDPRNGSAASRADASQADTTAISTAPAPRPEEMSENKSLSLSSPSRKIIKTADLRCRVADVFTATTYIEHLVSQMSGQISDSRMDNATDEKRSLPYKNDSLKELSSFTTTARLSLRVPVANLDTVLTVIAAHSAFLNSRNVHLDDVTLRYLSNRLRHEAMAGNDAAQRARGLACRSKDAVFSGEYADERSSARIDRSIENMQLNDQASYATLSVELYQPQRLSELIVPDIENLMKPGIGQQCLSALENGWRLLRAIFVTMLQIWPLALLIPGLWLLIRRSLNRRTLRVIHGKSE